MSIWKAVSYDVTVLRKYVISGSYNGVGKQFRSRATVLPVDTAASTHDSRLFCGVRRRVFTWCSWQRTGRLRRVSDAIYEHCYELFHRQPSPG